MAGGQGRCRVKFRTLRMVSGTAFISEDGMYRYKLTRSWDKERPELLVVMLNPSTADAAVDDPTIRRVMRFADDAGYGELLVMNLYALRSADPAALHQRDAVGAANDGMLEDALVRQRAAGERVLAAWGASEHVRRRASDVLALVSGVEWVCLGTTKDGHPRHPLYVPATQRMTRFAAVGGAS